MTLLCRGPVVRRRLISSVVAVCVLLSVYVYIDNDVASLSTVASHTASLSDEVQLLTGDSVRRGTAIMPQPTARSNFFLPRQAASYRFFCGAMYA